jgi:hypothetical protein
MHEDERFGTAHFQRTLKIRFGSFILMGAGSLLFTVALLADPLGIGGYPGLGMKQAAGMVLGVLLLMSGFLFNRKGLTYLRRERGEEISTAHHGFNNPCALLISGFFTGIMLFNLFYPFPSGPPDNGDFNRIFSSFSSGPVGFDFWPPRENEDVYQKRFYNFYHRFWRHDEGKIGFVHLTASRFFFWPGRMFNLTPGIFDLAYNAFLLTVLVGVVFYLSVRCLKGTPAVLSLGVIAFLFADANISGYLNSFYEEAGSFLSLFFLICVLHVFWARRNVLSLATVFILSLILAGTKISYTPSVLPAVLPLLAGVMVCSTKNSGFRRYSLIAIGLLFLGSVLILKFLSVTPGNERRANCYHFLFTGAIPALSPDAGRNYLLKVGLDPALVRLAGKNAYQYDSEFDIEPLRSSLTSQRHLTAVFQLGIHYPEALVKMIHSGFSWAGLYPRLQYPSLSDSLGVTSRFRWCFWSNFHGHFLGGIYYYGAVLCLILALGIMVWKRKDSGWPLFYLLCAGGFFPASLFQVLIAIVGNGPADIVKHLYLANLLLDVSLVSLAFGLRGMIRVFPRKGGKEADPNHGLVGE